MRIPTLGALTLAAAAAVVALPTAANAVPPVAVADAFQAQTATPKTFNVLTNDVANAGNQGKTLNVTGSTNGPNHATVSCLANGNCTYESAAGFTGTDSFTYTVSDGTETNTGTVTVKTFNVGSVGSTLVKHGTSTAASTLRWPDAIDLSTVVKDPAGTALSGVEVTLWAKLSTAGSVYQQIASKTTDINGAANMNNVRPDARTTYQWRTVAKNSVVRSVSVNPTLDATFSTKRAALGDPAGIVVSGVSSPATAGDSVVLQKLNGTGTWSTVANTTFASGSTSTLEHTGAAYSFTLPADAISSRTYRVSVPAQTGRNTVTSTSGTVKVYDAEISSVEPGSAATKQDEWVKIQNLGTQGLKLKDWKLSNGTVTLTIPSGSVAKEDFIKIHTGAGKNNIHNLYLGKANVWNNNSGTITLVNDTAFQLGDPVTYGTP